MWLWNVDDRGWKWPLFSAWIGISTAGLLEHLAEEREDGRPIGRVKSLGGHLPVRCSRELRLVAPNTTTATG